MAYGGGIWLTQNKVMPGTYINFSSLARATATLSDRGVAAAAFVLNWGPENEVFAVTNGDFQKESLRILGYGFNADEMLYFREIFKNATKVYCYRLGDGAVKATCTLADAKYGGTRGNNITVGIAVNADNANQFDVTTYVDSIPYDVQTVTGASELKGNDWVDWKGGATLVPTAGTPLTGGANATSITGQAHQSFLNAVEGYAYNILCCGVPDAATVSLYTAYTKRLRDDMGAKFQLVAWQASADYEGVIGAWNATTHPTIATINTSALAYWVAGAQAGVAVNRSLTNSVYDGELIIDVNYTQSQLEAAIKDGKFMFHNVNGVARVLEDINTLISLTDEKGDVFQNNQTMRVCDQIGNDVAALFNTRYVGKVANDASGRSALWNDVVKLIQQLESIRAVENFDTETVTVEIGEGKKTVLLIINGLDVVNAMSKLYMSVIIQ